MSDWKKNFDRIMKGNAPKRLDTNAFDEALAIFFLTIGFVLGLGSGALLMWKMGCAKQPSDYHQLLLAEVADIPCITDGQDTFGHVVCSIKHIDDATYVEVLIREASDE